MSENVLKISPLKLLTKFIEKVLLFFCPILNKGFYIVCIQLLQMPTAGLKLQTYFVSFLYKNVSVKHGNQLIKTYFIHLKPD